MSKRTRSDTNKGSAKKPKAIAVKSDQSPRSVISKLNDETLQRIFSYLSPMDLCAVKEVCLQFANAADNQFQKQYESDRFVFGPMSESRCKSHVVPPKFWSMFGKFIRKLDVHLNNGSRADQHWKGIAEECTRLDELSVFFCDLKLFQPNDFSERTRPLTSLLIACFYGNDDDYSRTIGYFADFERLGVQNILSSSVRCEFLRRNYPRLKEVCFENIEADEFFDEFVRLNPQLEKIFANRCALEYDRLDAIVEHCPSLVSLSIECDALATNFPEKIARLESLTALRELQFDCLYELFQEPIADAITTLGQKNLLQTLGLSGGLLDMDLCKALTKMKNLQTLKLVQFQDVTAILLKKLLGDMNLKHLHILWCEDVTYKVVAVAIKSCRTLKSLTFEFAEDCVLDDKCFTELVDARIASKAGFPLELVHIKTAYSDHVHTVGAKQLEENAQFIKMSKRDGLDDYITTG